jgi:hypothetical protein
LWVNIRIEENCFNSDQLEANARREEDGNAAAYGAGGSEFRKGSLYNLLRALSKTKKISRRLLTLEGSQCSKEEHGDRHWANSSRNRSDPRGHLQDHSNNQPDKIETK